jgi:hypothetical protein
LLSKAARYQIRRALNARGFSQREKRYQVVIAALRQSARVQRASSLRVTNATVSKRSGWEAKLQVALAFDKGCSQGNFAA